MAWNEPGNNGNDNDPWGGGRRGGDQGPPDIDEVIKDLTKRFNGLFGGKRSSSGGSSGGKPRSNISAGLLTGIVAVGALAWGFLGIYIVCSSSFFILLLFE